jgi:hypothetical protein
MLLDGSSNICFNMNLEPVESRLKVTKNCNNITPLFDFHNQFVPQIISAALSGIDLGMGVSIDEI